jgi:hypothetical protein
MHPTVTHQLMHTRVAELLRQADCARIAQAATRAHRARGEIHRVRPGRATTVGRVLGPRRAAAGS